MRFYRSWTALQAGLGVLLLLPSLALFPPSSRFSGHRHITPNEALASPSRPADWWSAVREDLRRREYHVTWQESSRALSTVAALSTARDGVGSYQAPNRAQNLRIGFYPTGVRITPRTPARPTWTWRLTLTGLGRDGTVNPVGAPLLSVHENHVTYQRGSLTESYTNDENGLEQSFQIANPRPPVVLELTLTGDLIPRLTTGSEQGSQAIELTTADGTPVLRYSFPPAAHLSLSSGESRLTPHASHTAHHAGRSHSDLPHHPPRHHHRTTVLRGLDR